MSNLNDYYDFIKRLQLLISKRPELITTTLSNIFSMRLIGNKTHGDLAEIGISEFINQFMYDFKSKHVGKDLFRSKEHEEDILVINELTNVNIPISLKAYGTGPLQLSTDKDSKLYTEVKKLFNNNPHIIDKKEIITRILNLDVIKNSTNINVMPLIYNENDNKCNIMIFDYEKALKEINKIVFVDTNEIYNCDTKSIDNGRRKHPVIQFFNEDNKYIFEIRYGGKTANALQRGLWTNTQRASDYFISITGWINYKHNKTLVEVFSLALLAEEKIHKTIKEELQTHINTLRDNKE